MFLERPGTLGDSYQILHFKFGIYLWVTKLVPWSHGYFCPLVGWLRRGSWITDIPWKQSVWICHPAEPMKHNSTYSDFTHQLLLLVTFFLSLLSERQSPRYVFGVLPTEMKQLSFGEMFFIRNAFPTILPKMTFKPLSSLTTNFSLINKHSYLFMMWFFSVCVCFVKISSLLCLQQCSINIC